MLFCLLSALGLVPTFQKTKCKKLLHTTMERIKLLEKRRQARVRQLHRDVIELLQLKKEYKLDPLLLRIWKELCLFFVYAKIAEYCGFVQINLKDIAGQRECPSGLEEPLAGLCFAASCCADLPELQELREIFATKYGKQIVSSGQDLQPNGNVNKQFLDCVYAKDPSEARKQALLEETIVNYNALQGREQDMLQQELFDSLGGVDANDCSYSVKRLSSEHHDGFESCGVLQEEGISTHLSKDVMPSEDLRILQYSQPPQRPPPPPPPPKRAPPPPASLRVSSHNDKQVNANRSLPRRCPTMTNEHYLETYGSHVHPKLPKYEDLVANFTALKH